jgi:hypothetical protein
LVLTTILKNNEMRIRVDISSICSELVNNFSEDVICYEDAWKSLYGLYALINPSQTILQTYIKAKNLTISDVVTDLYQVYLWNLNNLNSITSKLGIFNKTKLIKEMWNLCLDRETDLRNLAKRFKIEEKRSKLLYWMIQLKIEFLKQYLTDPDAHQNDEDNKLKLIMNKINEEGNILFKGFEDVHKIFKILTFKTDKEKNGKIKQIVNWIYSYTLFDNKALDAIWLIVYIFRSKNQDIYEEDYKNSIEIVATFLNIDPTKLIFIIDVISRSPTRLFKLTWETK